MNYLPVDQREPDRQYQRILRQVLEDSIRTETQQETDAITRFGQTSMVFDLENGFPMITERNMNPKESERLPVTIWQQAIGELCAFMNGARTLDQLATFGCHWWGPWGTEEKCSKRGLATGDLGPGSYGAAFRDFPTTEGKPFDQFTHLVEQIKELPHLRTHFVTPWVPQYIGRGEGKQQKVVVAPCHGWVHVRILNDELYLHMFQRSGDLPVGVPSNMVQYAALTLMLAQVTGYPAKKFVHTISDAHIYVNQLEAVEKMLSREPRPFPTINVDPSVNNILEFRREHFTLEDYYSHPGIPGIPVSI